MPQFSNLSFSGPVPFLISSNVFIPSIKIIHFLFCFKDFVYFQREGRGARKRGRETSMCERNISWLPLTRPYPRTWPETQAGALTGNQTRALSAHSPALNPLNHSSRGCTDLSLCCCNKIGEGKLTDHHPTAQDGSAFPLEQVRGWVFGSPPHTGSVEGRKGRGSSAEAKCSSCWNACATSCPEVLMNVPHTAQVTCLGPERTTLYTVPKDGG